MLACNTYRPGMTNPAPPAFGSVHANVPLALTVTVSGVPVPGGVEITLMVAVDTFAASPVTGDEEVRVTFPIGTGLAPTMMVDKNLTASFPVTLRVPAEWKSSVLSGTAATSTVTGRETRAAGLFKRSSMVPMADGAVIAGQSGAAGSVDSTGASPQSGGTIA